MAANCVQVPEIGLVSQTHRRLERHTWGDQRLRQGRSLPQKGPKAPELKAGPWGRKKSLSKR